MGKGDQKSKKGKRRRGSYGNSRKKTEAKAKPVTPRKPPARGR